MKFKIISFLLSFFFLLISCANFKNSAKTDTDRLSENGPSASRVSEIPTPPIPPAVPLLKPIAIQPRTGELKSAPPDSAVLDSPLPSEPSTALQEDDQDSTEDGSPDDTLGSVADTSSSESQKQGQRKMDEALDFCDVAQTCWQKGELDNALEALDKAYALILDVDTTKEDKLIQQKEDLRFLISKRILEIYASRNIVVSGNHDEIPLENNVYITEEIKRFTGGYEKDSFRQSLERSGLYRPYIVQALKQAGLPEELSWLPLIESGFKTKALSRARALGLWQFIPSTGYKFGLKRDRYIDERMDFIKATDAAIAYLRELHNIFGDWATVLAAYNCGEGRVLQVIRTQNINYLDDFWDLYQRLPAETARYVPRFFATLHIVKNPAKYGLEDVIPNPGLSFDTVTVDRELQLKDIASSTGIGLEDLKILNPELRYQILPPDGYELRIPKGTLQAGLCEKLAAIPTVTIPELAYVRYRVRSGDTLSTIAKKYRTSVSGIMRANNLRRSNFIRVGTRLKIPRNGYNVAATNVPEAVSPIPPSGIHRVRKGDSLWKIANRYGVTVQHIKNINGLSSSDLYIGQRLLISGSQTISTPDKSKLKTYYVKSGDSPYTIAQSHNMSLDRFLSINQLTPRSRIYPGQELSIE